MCELGLIDDRRYAEALAETLINIKGNAPKVAVMLMRQKGVDKELALEVVSSREDNLKEVIEKVKYDVEFKKEEISKQGTKTILAGG